MIHYSACPICKSESILPVFACRDYTVSGEMFPVWECASCSGRFTQDVPDADAIGPYYHSDAYISHTDTNKGLIARIYKIARGYTLRAKQRLVIRRVGRTGQLMDYGCGTGYFLKQMKSAGWQVIGVEPDDGARAFVEKNVGTSPLRPQDIFQLPNGQFDAITLWHVLEHVHTLQETMAQFHALLKPNGILCIAVPNFQSTDAKLWGRFWAAWDTPRHLYHFNPDSMDALVQRHGFTIVARKRMWLDAMYVSLLSARQVGKSGIRAVLVGCWSMLTTLFSVKNCSSVIYIIRKK